MYVYFIYRDADEKITDFTNIVAGGVSFIEVVLDYQTLTEHAINTTLTLDFSSSSHLVGRPLSIASTVSPTIYTCI